MVVTPEKGFDPEAVLSFWFEESSSEDWFLGSEDFDEKIRERFSHLPDVLANSPNEVWQASPKSALAAVLVLDQFTRNMYRKDPKSFSYDDKALYIARYAVGKGWDKQLPESQRAFIYMPYMHSEDLTVHKEGEPLFQSLSEQTTWEYEQKHVRILEMFGRYPHRNETLGRETTPAEKDFLENDPDSSF